MALRDIVTNEMIKRAVTEIAEKDFTTLDIIEILKKQEPDAIEELKGCSPRNWRAEIGKAISRYKVETNKIKRKLPLSKKQARWEKKN